MTGQLKTFTLARRGDGVSHEQLVERWRTTHAANVVDHMAPDGYTLTFFDPSNGKTPFDGMAELRFLDPERGRSVTGSNIPAAAAHDGWADLVALPNAWLRVAEQVNVAGPDDPTRPATREQREAAFKLTFLLTALPGLDREAVVRHWLEVHGPNFASNFLASGGVRYVVNVAERTAGTDLLGLAEISYWDRAAAVAHQVPDDGFRAMIDLKALPGREHVIV